MIYFIMGSSGSDRREPDDIICYGSPDVCFKRKWKLSALSL